MRLSEAMMLGSTTCRMIPTDINTCAFGAALNAMGVPVVNSINERPRYRAIAELWPWLRNLNPLAHSILSREAAAIWALFDNRVCGDQMTFEQLVDYVRSIEPQCGTCNEFTCICVKPEATAASRPDLAQVA